MEHIVQNAIKAERLVEARKALRRENKPKGETRPQIREIRRGTYLSQIYNEGENRKEIRTFNPQPVIICHTADKCRNRLSEINYNQIVCQVCSKGDHTANQCRNLMKSQICEKSGHLAKQCRSQDTGVNVCQLCNKAGHIANRCFKFKLNANNLSPQIEARSHLNCQLCERSGHTTATCRIRVDKICTYCKNKGHTIEECQNAIITKE